MDYTIVGADVNLAARLETACPPDEILISYQTHAHVRDVICCEEHGQIDVKGHRSSGRHLSGVDLFERHGRGQRPIHAALPHFDSTSMSG